MSEPLAYGSDVFVEGVRSRTLQNINGLTMHVLEAGGNAFYEKRSRKRRKRK